MLAVVVNDLAFASNSTCLTNTLKENFTASLKVKLLGKSASFIGWNIEITSTEIKIDQRGYAKSLIREYALEKSSATIMPTPKICGY